MMIKKTISPFIKNENGLTLLEILVAMALVGMVTLFVTGLMSHGIRQYQETEAQIEVLDNLDSAMNFMTKAIRESKKDVEVNDLIGMAPKVGRQLSYQDYDPSASPETPRDCIFKLDNGVLCRETPVNNKMALTTEEVTVTDLKFKEVSLNNIEISFTVKFKNGKTATMTSQAKARRGL